MKFSRQTWVGAAFGAVFAIAVPAIAGVAYKNLDRETALRRVRYDLVQPAVTDALGTAGVVMLNAYTGTSVDVSHRSGTAQTNIRTPTYPSVLRFGLNDASANDTLTCSSLTVRYQDQFGRTWVDTITTVTETMGSGETTRPVAHLISVEGTCVDGTDAGDALVAGSSLKVGLPARTRKLDDVESACISDASDSGAWKCAGLNTGDANDLQSNVNLTYDILDTSVAQFGPTTEVAAVAGDSLVLSVRSSWNYE